MNSENYEPNYEMNIENEYKFTKYIIESCIYEKLSIKKKIKSNIYYLLKSMGILSKRKYIEEISMLQEEFQNYSIIESGPQQKLDQNEEDDDFFRKKSQAQCRTSKIPPGFLRGGANDNDDEDSLTLIKKGFEYGYLKPEGNFIPKTTWSLSVYGKINVPNCFLIVLYLFF